MGQQLLHLKRVLQNTALLIEIIPRVVKIVVFLTEEIEAFINFWEVCTRIGIQKYV